VSANARPVAEMARPTTFIEAPRLQQRLGISLTIVSETFQHTGSFKFRAAYHVAASVPHEHLITASSGNFGQALAYACALVGKRATVVMPDTSALVKIEAVREFGGTVDLIDVEQVSRAARVAELGLAYPDAYLASAYDDPLVIAGNATLGAELATRPFDWIVAPVGGGGLTSGIITGLRAVGSAARVIGAEPLAGNDAARSLREGKIVRNQVEPQTLADGARTVSLGEHNWNILRTGLDSIVEVDEPAIAEGVRLLFALANLKAEPTGALSLGALFTAPEKFRGGRGCIVVSGGNVDPAVYRALLEEPAQT